jgi:hypothetical protein
LLIFHRVPYKVQCTGNRDSRIGIFPIKIGAVGRCPKALEWLEAALRLRGLGPGELKTDALLDPLRQTPRFQAIERALKFPSWDELAGVADENPTLVLRRM